MDLSCMQKPSRFPCYRGLEIPSSFTYRISPLWRSSSTLLSQSTAYYFDPCMAFSYMQVCYMHEQVQQQKRSSNPNELRALL